MPRHALRMQHRHHLCHNHTHKQNCHCVTDVIDLQEMYYRHLYATLSQPTLDQRRKSWENYVRLFNIILNTQVNMQVSSGPLILVFAATSTHLRRLLAYCARHTAVCS